MMMPGALQTGLEGPNIAKDQTINYNSLSLNHYSLESSRMILSIFSGAAIGIFGFTNLIGFGFFFILSILFSFITMSIHNLKDSFESKYDVFTQGLFNSLFSYILFWTLFFNLVHVY
eukprot:TRINITY_DN14957_c0_g1_i1.p1 TRINITY_DN14957_c0_g1~~TRINITY_DN14957_c0_g1_i1.p1  ORF type:complete len:117 (+),score=9.74 TRINITY_DN14957_c0_g1_i1:3-353(+)